MKGKGPRTSSHQPGTDHERSITPPSPKKDKDSKGLGHSIRQIHRSIIGMAKAICPDRIDRIDRSIGREGPRDRGDLARARTNGTE